MLDIKLIKTERELVEESLKNRNTDIDLQPIIDFDAERRNLLSELEMMKKQRNEVSAKIGKGELSGEEKTQAIQDTKLLGQKIKEGDVKQRELEEKIQALILQIPNILHETTPVGNSEDDNPLVSEWGTPTEFEFEPKHHADIGAELDILDAPRGVKIAKSRFTLLKAAGARLERALTNFMLDLHTSEHGYSEVLPPLLVNSDTMTGTGQLPKFEEDLFKTTDGMYLIPTAEVPVTNIYRNEILKEEQLPIYNTAFTPCFRSEAGSYGKDTKGYIRQHQFNKVELVKFVKPEGSMDELLKLRKDAERVLQLLELPYRVVTLCSADIGFSATKCFDIEVWLPSENKYREISSCSLFGDFQARRANIKYKSKDMKKPQFIHTINGSGLAVGRTLVAVLENYQQADGSVKIPKVLIPYMGGLTEIKK